jgi:sulfur-oxidizing protein SoxA
MTRSPGARRAVPVAACAWAALAAAGVATLLAATPTGGGASTVSAPAPAPDTRRSGYDDMRPGTRAMQDDDSQNPGFLWLQTGEAEYTATAGSAGRSCRDCHGPAREGLRGVAARYPVWDEPRQAPLSLAARINQCRTEQQAAPALRTDSEALLGLEALVGHASRGLPITPDPDPRLAPARERGRQLYAQRLGQLDLSCAQCHDRLAGGRLGGSTIPQGHPNGYPIYRLEWQGLGTLQRRLRNCLSGVRAEPWPDGAAEWTELELYLKQRAAGMRIETPAVRP